jgi:hypothetical protein
MPGALIAVSGTNTIYAALKSIEHSEDTFIFDPQKFQIITETRKIPIRDQGEVHAVHEKLDPLFERTLHDAGYTLVGWAEVGFVYLYSKTPVTSTAELKAQKVWLWEGDPLASAFFAELGHSAIPLSVTDVLLSLQTGLIDAVYSSTLAALSLNGALSSITGLATGPSTNSITTRPEARAADGTAALTAAVMSSSPSDRTTSAPIFLPISRRNGESPTR